MMDGVEKVALIDKLGAQPVSDQHLARRTRNMAFACQKSLNFLLRLVLEICRGSRTREGGYRTPWCGGRVENCGDCIRSGVGELVEKNYF